jgi:hypothetical protein
VADGHVRVQCVAYKANDGRQVVIRPMGGGATGHLPDTLCGLFFQL